MDTQLKTPLVTMFTYTRLGALVVPGLDEQVHLQCHLTIVNDEDEMEYVYQLFDVIATTTISNFYNEKFNLN